MTEDRGPVFVTPRRDFAATSRWQMTDDRGQKTEDPSSPDGFRLRYSFALTRRRGRQQTEGK